MKSGLFSGVMPALVTPLDAREQLNVPALQKLMADLAAQGADGFYIGGATGEGLALRCEVCEQLAVEAVRAAQDKPCILHIAATDYAQARHLARQAEQAGARAISAIPPLFFSYDEDDVYQYYKGLAQSVHIPLIIYYNPAAGFAMNAQFAVRLFEVDSIQAIKWTSSDLFDLITIKDQTNDEMAVLNGADEMLLAGLAAGADGGIGTSYNILMPLVRRILDGFRAGDISGAQKAQYALDRMLRILLKAKCIPATKAVLERMGYAVGNAAFPMKRYTEAEKDRLFAAMQAAGLGALA